MSTKIRKRYYRQSDTDRYALQCYSSGWALRSWVRDWGWWEYLPEKPKATGGRGIGRRRW